MLKCMHACMIAYLLFALWQERDAVSQALIDNLRQQIAVLQVDDEDNTEEVPEADEEGDDSDA